MHSRRPTVLVLNDDPCDRFTLASSLSGAGYRCFTPTDAVSALWFTLRLSPDAVVLDATRPADWQLAERLEQEPVPAGLVWVVGRGATDPRALDPETIRVSRPMTSAAVVAAVAEAAARHHDADAGRQAERRLAQRRIAERQRTLAHAVAGCTTAADADLALRRTFRGALPPLFVHARRVEQWSARLAARLGLSHELTRLIRGAALLHDIGKLALPDAQLMGAAPIGEGEMEALDEHHARTLDLLSHAERLAPLAALIAAVPEHWNGASPQGLAGEAIAVGARVVAVANALDEQLGGEQARHDRARVWLARQAGRQFDPALVEGALDLVDAVACS